jgi:tellurite resistance protein
MVSAFALVAAADGDIAAEEVERFGVLLKQQAGPLAPLPIEGVDSAFADVVAALLSDPEGSRARALRIIEALRGDEPYSELVAAVAQIALKADHHERAEELAAMKDIRKALGLAA